MHIIRHCLLLAVAASVTCAGSAASAQYTLKTLATFNDDNGYSPAAGLIADASGNLYGTTLNGGANGSGGYEYGTVFEVTAGTHAISTLATFTVDSTSGNTPWCRLFADSNGNLYGTTEYGAGNGVGAVFRVAAGTHALSPVASFGTPPTTGGYSQAGLIADAKGNLYGTTTQGGANGYGTVFQVAAGTHALSALVAFNAPNGPYNPYEGSFGELIADANGNLYGTTYGTGASGDGTVFEVTAGTHALITLATFNGLNGANPEAGLVADSSGNLYGTTSAGGANGFGTVFKVAAGTHTLSTLVSFVGGNALFAQQTEGDLIIGSNGNLYGMTPKGGPSNDGMVFEVDPNTQVLTTLLAFDGTNGQHPEGGLLADTSGNLYGTTRGGATSFSTVFELSPVPEPSSIALAGCGLATAALSALRRRAPWARGKAKPRSVVVALRRDERLHEGA